MGNLGELAFSSARMNPETRNQIVLVDRQLWPKHKPIRGGAGPSQGKLTVANCLKYSILGGIWERVPHSQPKAGRGTGQAVVRGCKPEGVS